VILHQTSAVSEAWLLEVINVQQLSWAGGPRNLYISYYPISSQKQCHYQAVLPVGR